MNNLIDSYIHVLIQREDRFLFIRRAGTGRLDGYWCPPGGKIEKGETPTAAAKRKILEEVGFEIEPTFVTAVYLNSAIFDHDGIVFFFASKIENFPTSCEAQEHDSVGWFPLDNLPNPVVPLIRFATDCYSKKQHYGEFTYE